VLQVRLTVEFLVQYHPKDSCRGAGIDSGHGQGEGARVVVLCPGLGEVHTYILLGCKQCPTSPGPLCTLLVDPVQRSAVFLC
jgi:hypothetical protein